MKRDYEKLIEHNKSVHDTVAAEYEERHTDIFNLIERARMRETLRNAVALIQTGNDLPLVLDYGAGTGNVTEHLLNEGVRVIASDVSEGMIQQLQKKFGSNQRCETFLLNGKDLSAYKDNTFDMVATYAVLHHVPDYLGIVEEFVRVVKPGGIVLIDHEAAPCFWKWNETYTNYLDELNRTYNQSHLEIPITYYYYSNRNWQKTPFRRFIRRWKNRVKQYLPPSRKENAMDSEEGDIHVYKHDHIEWDKIWARCAAQCRIVERTDYLVCRERNDAAPVWNKWKERCADMRLLIARKS